MNLEAPKYKVAQTNFDRWYDPEFTSLDAALEYGISKGFEATIYEFAGGKHGRIMASWSPIGGTRRYD